MTASTKFKKYQFRCYDRKIDSHQRAMNLSAGEDGGLNMDDISYVRRFRKDTLGTIDFFRVWDEGIDYVLVSLKSGTDLLVVADGDFCCDIKLN